jgi:hypothetical protein
VKRANAPITSIYYDSFTTHRPAAAAPPGKPAAGSLGAAGAFTEDAEAAASAHEAGRKQWPLAPHDPLVEKLYSAPLPVYHTRLHREDGASLMRLRWYGDGAAPEAHTKVGEGQSRRAAVRLLSTCCACCAALSLRKLNC